MRENKIKRKLFSAHFISSGLPSVARSPLDTTLLAAASAADVVVERPRGGALPPVQTVPPQGVIARAPTWFPSDLPPPPRGGPHAWDLRLLNSASGTTRSTFGSGKSGSPSLLASSPRTWATLPSVSALPSCASARPTTTSGWDFKLATRVRCCCCCSYFIRSIIIRFGRCLFSSRVWWIFRNGLVLLYLAIA